MVFIICERAPVCHDPFSDFGDMTMALNSALSMPLPAADTTRFDLVSCDRSATTPTRKSSMPYTSRLSGLPPSFPHHAADIYGLSLTEAGHSQQTSAHSIPSTPGCSADGTDLQEESVLCSNPMDWETQEHEEIRSRRKISLSVTDSEVSAPKRQMISRMIQDK
jgi:hypothetical protein